MKLKSTRTWMKRGLALLLSLLMLTGCLGVTAFAEEAVHEHDWQLTDALDPTCTEAGCQVYTCSGCGESDTQPLEPLDHSWDEGAVRVEPTQEAEGERVFTCVACGAERSETIEKLPAIKGPEATETETVAQVKVSFEAPPAEAKNTVTGNGTYTITIDMGGHGENLTTQAATGSQLSDVVQNKVYDVYSDQGPTADGYRFEGFSLTALGENPTGEEIGNAMGDYGGATVTGDTTVYAVWRKLYTITIDMQGRGDNITAQAAGGESLLSAAGSHFDEGTPTADGYEFACFSTTPLADNPSENTAHTAMEATYNTVVSETNTTVYVAWRELCSVTINMHNLRPDLHP